MIRAIPLALLLGAAVVGCGNKGGDDTGSGRVSPPASGGDTSADAPKPPTARQRQEYLPVIGKLSVAGADIGEPANGANGPIYELDNAVTDAGILTLRDPGYAFGLRLTSPKLTDAAVTACARFPSLVYFSLNKAKGVTAAGAAELAKMRNLRVLELTDMPVEDAWLVPLRSLPELRRVNLYNAHRVTDAGLAHLSGLAHLRQINFHHTRVTGSGLGSLGRAKELNRVYLNEQSDAALKALAKIGKLHALEEALTTAEVRPLAAADVTKFAVRGPVTDAGLKEVTAFPNLTHLYLRGDKVTTASLPFLKTLKKLKYLELGFSTTAEQREELTTALPGCEIH